MTRILFSGRTDPAPKIFAIEGNPTPPNTYFIACLGHFEVKILKKYLKFCENSQSTNILPQIWFKVQIL